MILRAVAASAALAASLVLLTGCLAPAPDPTPTPTAAFASEAEAFAAAEETYRAYVDAANNVDLAEPATFEPMYAWTTGTLSAEARKAFSQMHADGWTVRGVTRVVLVEGDDSPEDYSAIALAICQDVSDVSVIDAGGESVVAPDRPDTQSLEAELVADESSPTGYLIERIEGREGEPTCGD